MIRRTRNDQAKSETSMIYQSIKALKEKSNTRILHDSLTQSQSNTVPVKDIQLNGKFNKLIWFIQKTMQLPKPVNPRKDSHLVKSVDRKPLDFSIDNELMIPTTYLQMSTGKKRNTEASHKEFRLRHLSSLSRRIYQEQTSLPVVKDLYVGRKDVIMSRMTARNKTQPTENPEDKTRKAQKRIRRRANKIMEKFNRFQPDKLEDINVSVHHPSTNRSKVKESLSYLAMVSAADF